MSTTFVPDCSTPNQFFLAYCLSTFCSQTNEYLPVAGICNQLPLRVDTRVYSPMPLVIYFIFLYECLSIYFIVPLHLPLLGFCFFFLFFFFFFFFLLYYKFVLYITRGVHNKAVEKNKQTNKQTNK